MPIPISKTHADWLSLIEISGPFVSMPILAEVFPQGLEDVPAELARSLKADFEFWQESSGDVAVHSAWVKLVLESLLGYSSEVLLSGQAIPAGLKAEFPEHEETVRADFVLVEPRAVNSEQLSVISGERKPKLLIQVFPPTQDLGKAVTGSRWAASVGTRMMELLHATEIRLGLVTNGEQWMLVDAPRGETTGFTTWYASLWFDERTTLNAFQSLLGARRFFGVAEDETLENLLARSANHQQEVTDQLGLQVRHAVEILIQAVDKAEQNRGAKSSRIAPDLLYEAALTVMMRLVFLLSAEERKLLPIDDDQYSNYYAVSTLREQLQTLASQQGEEVLERRFDAWSRLLAVFRAVHGGIRHQELNLPAYGGSLFNPDRFPFLEGRMKDEGGRMNEGQRKEVPLAIDNRTVLHLLDALQLLRVDGEMRRLSFRALDVEQIGHVYEGLLDHKAVRSVEVMLGLGGAKRLEPEMALSRLEQERVKGEASFVAWLKEETQKSPAALKNILAKDISKDLSHLRNACGNDDALLGRILPFAGLIRMDDFGNPAVILPGSVYVTAGTSRRATGSHYTPRSLTEPIVQHTLEPLVYAGVAEGLPREEWKLRSAEELLDLKICDMAMGSAGFLVQVVRYLAERLVESWQVEKLEGSTVQSFKPENVSMTDEDLLNYARRLVAERCIYGVDKNPLAVEIAKLSLWLVTLAKEKPFTFLDHALKCGDALVGTSAEDFLRWANRKRTAAMSLDQEVLREELDKARGLRKQLESFVALDVRDAERKSALLVEADAAMEHVKRGADLLAGVKLLGLSAQDAEDLQLRMVDPFLAGLLDGSIDADKHPDSASALSAAKKERVFHWEFEFPEVFERGGFSAFVGNPPFLGGKQMPTYLGVRYATSLKFFFTDANGNSDFAAYFYRKCFDLLSRNGKFGLIATKSIAESDTRLFGLEKIINAGGLIYRADVSIVWPGEAAIVISVLYVSKGMWKSSIFLNGNSVANITSSLSEDLDFAIANRLNHGIYYSEGTKLYGGAFIRNKLELDQLLTINSGLSSYIRTYVNGDVLNGTPNIEGDFFVIDFEDRNRKEIKGCEALIEELSVLVSAERINQTRQIHESRPWLHWDKRLDFYDKARKLERVLACTIVSTNLAFVFTDPNKLYAHGIKLFADSRYGLFALLQSSLHEIWARATSSTLGMSIRYSTSTTFDKFPLQHEYINLVEHIGNAYHNYRNEIMQSRQEGLTATYNRFHNPEEGAGDIVRLRELHVEMDKAVARAYGWLVVDGGQLTADGQPTTDNRQPALDLGHGFHETAQGIRFTVSESARREILSRLLKLNHERWEEEQKAAGEAQKAEGGKPKKVKKKAKPKSTDGQMGLL